MKKIILLVFATAMLTSCGKTVEAGHKGVFFGFFSGTDSSTSYDEGFHFLLPWNRLTVYDVRLQEIKEDMKIITADQLNLKIEVSLQYRLDGAQVQVLHTQLGPRYHETAIIPGLRNVVRDVITKYKAIEAYTKREEIQLEVNKKFSDLIKKYPFFIIENILIRDMVFPTVIEEAINKKLAEQQEAERMHFVIEKERLEAERKKIEAQGISDFQNIVTQGINENLLRWKAIEATLKLAESQNSKVVIIGSGKDGVPVILGNK